MYFWYTNRFFKTGSILRKSFLLFFVVTLANIARLQAQEKWYSLSKDSLKNTVRMNITNSLIFGSGNLVFGYERVLKPSQSFSVNIGLAAFPEIGLLEFDSIEFSKESKGSGLNFAIDYRFYLLKENRHTAPRGMYIGPYYTFNQMNRVSTLNILLSSGVSTQFDMNNRLTITAAGFELGYQFLFYHDRIALDLITFGPAFGFYKYSGELTTDLDLETESRLVEALSDYLTQRYPGVDKMFQENVFSLNDNGFSSMYGFRLVAHIGYRF